MANEVAEDTFVKLSKEEVGYLKAFYSTTIVTNAAESWKKKSVSIVSPKSGRILRNKKSSEKKPPKSEKNGKENGFFKRLFEDFKKAKVSDYPYQQSNIRKNSSYKPFWATKVVQPVAESNVEEPAMSSKKVDLIEHGNAATNRNMIFAKEVIGSPKVTLTSLKPSRESTPTKRLSSVDRHHENRLKMPSSYKGSQMFMRTGEQVFWVCHLFNYLFV